MDTGSNVNLITQKVANDLKLRREAQGVRVSINTVHGSKHIISDTVILSLRSKNRIYRIPCYVVTELQDLQGSNPLILEYISECSDPFPRMWPIQLDGILSVTSTLEIAKNQFEAIPHIPGMFQWQTVFGKSIFGTPGHNDSWNTPIRSTYLTATERLSLVLDRLLHIQDLPGDKAPGKFSEDDLLSFKQLEQTLIYSEKDKRFCCELLLKDDYRFVNNFKQAAARLHKSWIKCASNASYRKAYISAIEKLIADDHVEQVFDPKMDDPDHIVTYLPHSLVARETSITTPFRLVMDGSTVLETHPKRSFNDNLYQGMSLHRNLQGLLLRFRRHPFILSGDIRQLFLNVNLHPKHRDYCRFLWKDDIHAPIKVYRFKVLLFGLSCAPTIAMGAIHKLCRIVLENSTSTDAEINAANRLAQDIYVDDFLSGFDTVQEMQTCYQAINAILEKASFEMRKFMSNDLSFMQTIPEGKRLPGIVDQIDDTTSNQIIDVSYSSNNAEDTDDLTVPLQASTIPIATQAFADLYGPKMSTSTLGYRYNVAKDIIQYDQYEKLHELNGPLTLRVLASKSARIFDPLGLLEGFKLVTKAILSTLLDQGYTWTQKIPESHADYPKFMTWLQNTKDLKKISYPRYAPYNSTTLFAISCDACNIGISAVVHAITTINGKTHSNLLFTKVKVVNRKTREERSMAVLELCGIFLAAKTAKFLMDHLNINNKNIIISSDSKVALQWLAHRPQSLQPFIANRVRKIQETDIRLRHISGKMNPADIYSRSHISPLKFQSSLILNGPDYYKLSVEEWPLSGQVQKSEKEQDLYTAGLKKEDALLATHATIAKASKKRERKDPYKVRKHVQLNKTLLPFVWTKGNLLLSILDTRSTYNRVIHDIARILLAIEVFRRRIKTFEAVLISTFKEKAQMLLEKAVQKEYFSHEIRLLTKNKPLRKGPILNLLPFLDEDGLLRAQGRIVRDDITKENRFPIILPKTKYAFLKARHLHLSHYHAIKTSLLGLLMDGYHILKVQSLARQIVTSCIRCQKFNLHRVTEQMGPLLDFTEQTLENRAWQYISADYVGPVRIKTFIFANPKTGENQVPFNKLRVQKGRVGRPPKNTDDKKEKALAKKQIEGFSHAYLCIFHDLWSKMCHIEVLVNETAAEQVRALLRLIARRGQPKLLVTDDANNFKGALQFMNRFHDNWSKVLTDISDKYQIQHKVITGIGGGSHSNPSERVVQAVKKAFLASTKNTLLSFTELSSLLCEVEIFLNSKALTSITENSYSALQPVQLGIGRRYKPLTDLTPIHFKDLKDFKMRWRYVNNIMTSFQNTYFKLYTPLIQTLTKWNLPSSRAIEVGKLCLVYEPNVKPAQYQLARVVKIYPGRDGKIRQVDLSCGNNTKDFTRHIRAIIPLAENLYDQQLLDIERHLNKIIHKRRARLGIQDTDNDSSND